MYSWGDYTHFHYASAWCILAGYLSLATINNVANKCFIWPLFDPVILIIMASFFIMGFISDWRLKSLREYIFMQQFTP